MAYQHIFGGYRDFELNRLLKKTIKIEEFTQYGGKYIEK